MNNKIDQNLILKPIKLELAKQIEEKCKSTNKAVNSQQTQIIDRFIGQDEDIQSETSYDSVIDNEDFENMSGEKEFKVFEDDFVQEQFIIQNAPMLKQMEKDQKQIIEQRRIKYQEKIYLNQFSKYQVRLSKKDYAKHLLDPTFLQRKREDDQRKIKESQLKLQQEKNKEMNTKKRRRKADDKNTVKLQQQTKQIQESNQQQQDINKNNDNNEINENIPPQDTEQQQQQPLQQEKKEIEIEQVLISNSDLKLQPQQQQQQQETINTNTNNNGDIENGDQKKKKKRRGAKSKQSAQKDEDQVIKKEEDLDADEKEEIKKELKIETDQQNNNSQEEQVKVEVKQEENNNNNNIVNQEKNVKQEEVNCDNITQQQQIQQQQEKFLEMSKQQGFQLQPISSNHNKKLLNKEQRQQIDQEEHQKRISQLNPQQFFQFKLYSCFNTYKQLKFGLEERYENKFFYGQDVIKDKFLLDRQFFCKDRQELMQYRGDLDQDRIKRKERGDGDQNFELKIIKDQKQKRLKKHQDFLKILYQHHTQFFEFHKQVRKKTKKRCILAKTSAENRHRKLKKQEDQENQSKLQVLRNNNIEEYLAMIKNTKSKKIQQLLQQTDNFLRQLGGKVLVQKGNKIDKDFDEEVVFGEQSEDYVQNFIQSNKVYYNLTHSVEEKVEKQPELIKFGNLKNYQLVGLQWMVSLYNNKLNGILADEMGLGKTIQTISLFAYLIEVKKVFGPYLVVVPLSTLSNWQMEFEKWCPELKYVVYKGSPVARKEIAKWMKVGSWHACITTYDYILKDKATLTKWNWKYIVVDEGHRMKNSRSKFAQILGQQYQSEYRILLTGTPLQNNLAELWALLNFLLPKVFESCDDFEKWFSLPLGKNQQSSENTQLSEEEQLLIINRLHQVLRPFLLRRVKKEVEAELPSKTECVIKVDMSPWQKLYYQQLEQKQQVCQDPNTGKVQFSMLNNLVMQLRKICNHPYLFLNDFMIDDDLWRVSGKMELLDRILPKLLKTKHRMLIFTQMTQVMDIMQYYFELKGLKFLRLDGATKADERGESQREFNMENSEYDIFILSTRAGGLGLNLQSADTVIIFDSDWNPQQDLQAQDRAHRIGSKSEVRVFRLVTARSVEESILTKAKYKRGLDEMIIQAGMYNQKSSQDERTKQIEMLIERKKDDQEEDEYIPNDEQINDMISRSDQEFEYFQQMDRERYEVEKQIYPDFQYPNAIKDSNDGEDIDDEEDSDNDNKVKSWYNYRFISEDAIPEWIKVGSKQQKEEQQNTEKDEGRGSRQRKNVNYNESMSHVEFMRMIGEYKTKEELQDIRRKKCHLKQYENEEQEDMKDQDKLLHEKLQGVEDYQDELMEDNDIMDIESFVDYNPEEEIKEQKKKNKLKNKKKNNNKNNNRKQQKNRQHNNNSSSEDEIVNFDDFDDDDQIFQSEAEYNDEDDNEDYDNNNNGLQQQQNGDNIGDDDLFIEDDLSIV